MGLGGQRGVALLVMGSDPANDGAGMDAEEAGDLDLPVALVDAGSSQQTVLQFLCSTFGPHT